MFTTATTIAASIVLAFTGAPAADATSSIANLVAKYGNVHRALRPWNAQAHRALRPWNAQAHRALRPWNAQAHRALRPWNAEAHRALRPW